MEKNKGWLMLMGMIVLGGAVLSGRNPPSSAGFGRSATAARLAASPTNTAVITSATRQAVGPVETVVIPLVRAPVQQISGVFASAEFFVRLPEHIQIKPGSQLELIYHASPVLLPDVCTMTVLVNGTKIDSRRILGIGSSSTDRTRITVPVQEDLLKLGWNKITVACFLQTTSMLCRDVDNPATWLALERGCAFKLSYQRLPLFPELQRFPHSIAEEQLLHPDPLVPGDAAVDCGVALFHPETLDDATLRAFAIASARLSQSGYLLGRHCQVAPLGEWAKESSGRNGVIVALRDEAKRIPLPEETKAAVEALKPGQGLVAEFFTGSGSSQRRWMLVTGADAMGFENAALALGSSHALSTAGGNPLVVNGTPVIPDWLEQRSKPGKPEVTFRKLGVEQLKFQGVFRNEQSLEWPLPPGYQSKRGSEMELLFNHSMALIKPTSAVEVVINGQSIGSVGLTPENASTSLARVAIPPGITGRDPMTVSFRAYLDIGSVDCGHRNEESAWFNISGDSKIRTRVGPVEIKGLENLRDMQLRDSFMRRMAWVVPAPLTVSGLKTLQALIMSVGSQVAASPVLWPQVATYAEGRGPDPERVRGRSAVLLGSAKQWRQALGSTALGIAPDPASPGQVMLQGNRVPVGDLEPTLSFLQFLKSPWSPGENVVVAGGGRIIPRRPSIVC